MAKGVCGSSSLEINFCTIGDYVRLVSHTQRSDGTLSSSLFLSAWRMGFTATFSI